jgi:hypothetical protein
MSGRVTHSHPRSLFYSPLRWTLLPSTLSQEELTVNTLAGSAAVLYDSALRDSLTLYIYYNIIFNKNQL